MRLNTSAALLDPRSPPLTRLLPSSPPLPCSTRLREPSLLVDELMSDRAHSAMSLLEANGLLLPSAWGGHGDKGQGGHAMWERDGACYHIFPAGGLQLADTAVCRRARSAAGVRHARE